MDEILKNWNFWGWLIHSALIIAGFCLLKFNDFKHLTKDVKIIWNKIDCLEKKVINSITDIAVLKEKTKDL